MNGIPAQPSDILTFDASLGRLRACYGLFKILYDGGRGIISSYSREGKFWFTNASQDALVDVRIQLSFSHLYRGVVLGDRQPTWYFPYLNPGETVAREIAWDWDFWQLTLEASYREGSTAPVYRHTQDLDDSDDHEPHGQYNVVVHLFDVKSKLASAALIDVGRFLNPRLLDYFRANPRRLYEADPHVFEQLVGDLFASMGFRVALTGRSHDGGVDFIAINETSNFPVKFVVQCKRYAPHRRVSVDFVRELYGIVQLEGATKGILATTSFFTKDAIELGKKLMWHVDLKDYNNLVEWLSNVPPKKGSVS